MLFSPFGIPYQRPAREITPAQRPDHALFLPQRVAAQRGIFGDPPRVSAPVPPVQGRPPGVAVVQGRLLRPGAVGGALLAEGRYYFYYNLGFSRRVLFPAAFTLDALLFVLLHRLFEWWQ
jgi:hypothetical protein